MAKLSPKFLFNKKPKKIKSPKKKKKKEGGLGQRSEETVRK